MIEISEIHRTIEHRAMFVELLSSFVELLSAFLAPLLFFYTISYIQNILTSFSCLKCHPLLPVRPVQGHQLAW